MTSADRPLQVVQIITTLARGGAQATVLASADPGDAGVEVRVLAGVDVTGEGDWWDDPALAGARVEPVPHLVRRLAPIQDLAALVWLVRRLRELAPDVVHTHSSKAGVLGRLAARVVGVPCVHTVHGWGPLYARRSIVRLLAAAVERVLARSVAALVLVGRADVELAMTRKIGDPARYRLIRSGVELADAAELPERRRRLRAELDLDGRFVVGMVGRLAHPKDQETLVAAFRAAGLPNSTLVLVGDGPDRPALEQLASAAARTGCDVRLTGARTDGAELVSAFDVAVHSSRWEGMPRTVVEAAACGVPLVATDVGSIDELVEDRRSGRLVEPGDVTAMSAALVELHLDPAGAAALAAVARARTDPFSADNMRRELVTLWREVAGRPSPVAPSAEAPVGPITGEAPALGIPSR